GAQLVEIVGDQAGVPSDLVLAALLTVDVLDHDEGDHDLVVLEGVDRIRVVQQDVRVKHIDLFHRLGPPSDTNVTPQTLVWHVPRHSRRPAGRCVEDVDLLHASARCRTDELAYSPWFSNGRSAAIFVIR